jgi:FAD-dependent urate hydroxylase
MGSTGSTVIIGAGPYSLSVAAHLRTRQATMVFGKPLEFWQHMPPHMYLKSSWKALSFSDPLRLYSLDRYSMTTGKAAEEPVSLQTFLSYGQWFQEQVVPDVDKTYVKLLRSDGPQFHLDLADGRNIRASRVVVASGIAPFAHIPDFARAVPRALVSHSQDHADYSSFQGKPVIVIGKGQSALEAAALLHEAGALVELIARGNVAWIDRRLARYTGPVKRFFYPPSDVGPPGVNWLVAFPLLFRYFPEKARVSLDARAVRPAGARWLRSRVEGVFRITPNTAVIQAKEHASMLHLMLSDGTTRVVDHMILGTGYRPDIEVLDFIDGSLQERIIKSAGTPVLNQWFESSVPSLYFAGALAGSTFGPLCRFVVGARTAAHQIAYHALHTGQRSIGYSPAAPQQGNASPYRGHETDVLADSA